MSRRNVFTCRQYGERGRTLIELLVAIALGILILLGVGSLYLGASQSTRSMTGLASAEESGAVALRLIGNAIKRAGYAEIIGTGDNNFRENLLYSGPLVRACKGVAFDNIATDDYDCGAATAAPDMLAVWFQADTALARPQAETQGCLGNDVITPLPVANGDYRARVPEIFVVRNIYRINGNRLQCRGTDDPNFETLLDGVEDLKVYFGFDDLAFANPAIGTERPTARSIRSADEIHALTDPAPTLSRWDYVVSVHVCVLVATGEAGVTAAAGQTYELCPQTADQARGLAAIPTAISADGRIRRAYTEVFTVRSRAAQTPAT
jgi:type IV pilus assembly protein PilW